MVCAPRPRIAGPCRPLRDGIVDALSSVAIPAVGPTALGATIVSSKAWAAELAATAGILMPATHAFDSADAADAFVKQQGRPYVVKPDGEALAATITVSDSVEDTHAAIRFRRRSASYAATPLPGTPISMGLAIGSWLHSYQPPS
jgi:phosphoribosylamine--glycine ligase